MSPVLSPPKPKKRKRLSIARLLEKRIEQVDEQLADTRREMRAQFAQVREQFALAEKRIDVLREETNQQFAQVREQFALAEKRIDVLREETNQQFAQVREEFAAVRQESAGHTNFLGVMITSMSLIIIVAISILGWVMKH